MFVRIEYTTEYECLPVSHVTVAYNVQIGRRTGGFPGGSVVRNLPAVQDTWVRSLGREDPLEEGMAAHSSVLAWRAPWTEEPGGLQSTASPRVGHN